MSESQNTRSHPQLILNKVMDKAHWSAYPAYRETGCPWLRLIPEHWQTKRLKYLCKVNPSKSEISALPRDTEVSYIPMEFVGNGFLRLEQSKRIVDVWQGLTYFRDGDIIVAKITPSFENGKGAIADGLKNGIGFGTTELHVLRAENGISTKFIYYLTLSHPFQETGAAFMYGTAGQKRVPDSFVINFPTPLPPISEQRAIATFLDRHTSRIDTLIAKKQRLIELLEEKRAALISQAVTKGLNPSVRMKHNGIEWLGEVPAHWQVRRLKTLTPFVTSGSRWWAQYYSEQGAIFLRIGNLSRKSIDLRLDDIQFVSPPEGAEMERTRVKTGDVLVSITAYIGSVGVVNENISEAYVNQHIALIRPNQDQVDPRWLAYCLLSDVGQGQFQLLLYGGTKDGLGLDDVKKLSVLIPPLHEQYAVIAYIDQQTKYVDALVAKNKTAIEKLREYRISLISAVVTGKIDVRYA